MRGLLAATLILTGFLAGCTDDGTGGPTTGPSTTSTMTTPASNGTLAQFSCTIQFGLSGNANLNNGTGGCIFTTASARDGTIQDLQPAGGCTAWFDTTPGDAQTEGTATAGGDYPAGSAFGVYCDATASPGARSTMSLLYD